MNGLSTSLQRSRQTHIAQLLAAGASLALAQPGGGDEVEDVSGVSRRLSSPELGAIFSLATLVPGIAIGIRRLHDIDKSGWWLLIGLIPIVGALVLIYFFVQKPTPGPNRFG